MLRVTLLMTQVTLQRGEVGVINRDRATAYICPQRIDTITECSKRSREQLGLPQCRSIIRYLDATTGYRIFMVEEDAASLAKERSLWLGQDPPDAFKLNAD